MSEQMVLLSMLTSTPGMLTSTPGLPTWAFSYSESGLYQHFLVLLSADTTCYKPRSSLLPDLNLSKCSLASTMYVNLY